jgi:hypothetical protein
MSLFATHSVFFLFSCQSKVPLTSWEGQAMGGSYHISIAQNLSDAELKRLKLGVDEILISFDKSILQYILSYIVLHNKPSDMPIKSALVNIHHGTQTFFGSLRLRHQHNYFVICELHLSAFVSLIIILLKS